MRICYECLKKQCEEHDIYIWQSDFFYSLFPGPCGFCRESRRLIHGVRLHALGNRRLVKHLLRVYETTRRMQADGK